MRLNFNLSLIGKLTQLVPYREKFVMNYHQWMQSDFLLQMTGSESLTLEEEYEMQQSWRDDDKKCTFIILANEKNVDEIQRMVGDINLFISKDDEGHLQAEIDVMIAEERYRRKGMGIEAVVLMMWYGVQQLGIRKFFAKIKKENNPSLSLFQKLGYSFVNYVEVFEEYEYQYIVENEEQIDQLKINNVQNISIYPYD